MNEINDELEIENANEAHREFVETGKTHQQSRTYTYNGAGVLVGETSTGGTTRYVQDLAAPLSQVLQIQQGPSTTRVVYGRERLFATLGGTRVWFRIKSIEEFRYYQVPFSIISPNILAV
ncbi:MAG: hypothetical protein OHK0022_44910 [Roseiflexaceae bacterium]